MFKPLPNPSEEVIKWAEANRPDMVHHLRQVIDQINDRWDTRSQAMLLLATSFFAAGRWYQLAHSDERPLGENPYKD